MLQKKMDLFGKIIFRTGFMPRGIGRVRVSGLRSNEGESRNPGKPVKNGLLKFAKGIKRSAKGAAPKNKKL